MIFLSLTYLEMASGLPVYRLSREGGETDWPVDLWLLIPALPEGKNDVCFLAKDASGISPSRQDHSKIIGNALTVTQHTNSALLGACHETLPHRFLKRPKSAFPKFRAVTFLFTILPALRIQNSTILWSQHPRPPYSLQEPCS